MEKKNTLSLKDGRKLGLAQYGEREGIPVFYFHGYPTSRLEASLMEPYTSDLNIRLIALDRPGYGLSDFLPGRQILDWPDDVIECADMLGIDKFSVVGVSGGGPYALACAYNIPERLKKVSVVCGLGPLHTFELRKMMRWPIQISFVLITYFPGLMKWLYKTFIGKIISDRPGLVLLYMNLFGAEKDKKVIKDEEKKQKFLKATHESVRNGTEGVLHDLYLYSRFWGFELEEITVPVSFWQGEKDATVPTSVARHQAETVPRAETHFLADEGHFSLIATYGKEIFSEFLE
jgi:pimeloyl-ACP methyl ester carboxylesterase